MHPSVHTLNYTALPAVVPVAVGVAVSLVASPFVYWVCTGCVVVAGVTVVAGVVRVSCICVCACRLAPDRSVS